MTQRSLSDGFVLIGIMVLLAIFGLISGLLSFHANNATRLSAQAIQNRRANLMAITKSFTESASALNSKDRFVCNKSTAKSGAIEATRRLCWLNGKGEIIDYDYYLSRAILPPSSIKHLSNSSRFGFILTPGSNRSPYSIQFDNLKAFLPRVQVLSNIEQLSDAEISSNDEDTIIATPGYIDLSGNLNISSNTTLIAGGDLHIGSIHVSSPSIHVQLVSGTGVVSVESITADVSINIEAPIGVFLPPNVNFQNGTDLKRKELFALGFESTETN
jgi:type II secretory pathway pseudopilin PulG